MDWSFQKNYLGQESEYSKLFSQKIQTEDQDALQSQFKNDVPYWRSLRWQLASDIWNDIRMSCKYGFKLFHKFLKENKPIVIKANGKGFNIVNQFQNNFNQLVEIFNYFKHNKQTIKQLSKKKLGFESSNFQQILFSIVTKQIEDNNKKIDYNQWKSQINQLQQKKKKSFSSNLYLCTQKKIEITAKIVNEKYIKAQKPQNSKIPTSLLNKNQNKQTKIIEQKSNIIEKSNVKKKKEQNINQSSSSSNTVQPVANNNMIDQIQKQQNSQEITQQQNKNIKKFCLIRQFQPRSKIYQSLKDLKRQGYKITQIVINMNNDEKYREQTKELNQNIDQHQYFIIEVDLENQNSSKYAKSILQILFDRDPLSKQQKLIKKFQHVALSLFTNSSYANYSQLNMYKRIRKILFQVQQIVSQFSQSHQHISYKRNSNSYKQLFSHKKKYIKK